MPKLLLSIIAIFAISVALLQLRQQRLSYKADINRLHEKIEASQTQLWKQQIQIADRTNPEAMVRRMQRASPAPAAVPPSSVRPGSEGVAGAGPSGANDQASAIRPSTSLPSVEPSRRWLDSRVIP